MNPYFEINKTPNADVLYRIEEDLWSLKIHPGPKGNYRLAQLDDGIVQTRDLLPWKPPVTLSLRARVSANDIPGTWGFGFWNDPFSISLGFGGGKRRFPALPNAAWFFFSSPHNYLSFRNTLPANGFVAQTFRSSRFPRPLLALGALGFPLLLWPRLACKLRSLFHDLIAESSFPLNCDVTQWNRYTLEWLFDQVVFKTGNQIFETRITPNASLGFVLWIDNQYAAFPPNGKLSYGTLANTQTAWLEIGGLELKHG